MIKEIPPVEQRFEYTCDRCGSGFSCHSGKLPVESKWVTLSYVTKQKTYIPLDEEGKPTGNVIQEHHFCPTCIEHICYTNTQFWQKQNRILAKIES